MLNLHQVRIQKVQNELAYLLQGGHGRIPTEAGQAVFPVLDDHELRGNSGGLQSGIQNLRLLHGGEAILFAVDDQKGRVIRRDVSDRADGGVDRGEPCREIPPLQNKWPC